MRVVGWQDVPVSTLAGGLTVWGGSCVYALNPTLSGTMTVTGTSTLNSACGIYDNSNSSSALIVSGGGILQAPLVGVVGGTTVNGGGSTPPSTGIAAFCDPLAWVSQPTVPPCTNYNMKRVSGIVYPTKYCGGIKINGGADITLMPCTYIFKAGCIVTLSLS